MSSAWLTEKLQRLHIESADVNRESRIKGYKRLEKDSYITIATMSLNLLRGSLSASNIERYLQEILNKLYDQPVTLAMYEAHFAYIIRTMLFKSEEELERELWSLHGEIVRKQRLSPFVLR